MVTIINYWAETGPTAHVSTNRGQSMVVRGHELRMEVTNGVKMVKMAIFMAKVISLAVQSAEIVMIWVKIGSW